MEPEPLVRRSVAPTRLSTKVSAISVREAVRSQVQGSGAEAGAA